MVGLQCTHVIFKATLLHKYNYLLCCQSLVSNLFELNILKFVVHAHIVLM